MAWQVAVCDIADRLSTQMRFQLQFNSYSASHDNLCTGTI